MKLPAILLAFLLLATALAAASPAGIQLSVPLSAAPGAQFHVAVQLLDSSGKAVEGQVTIQLLDSQGRQLSSTSAVTSQELLITAPAAPGTYMIRASFAELHSDSSFMVRGTAPLPTGFAVLPLASLPLQAYLTLSLAFLVAVIVFLSVFRHHKKRRK